MFNFILQRTKVYEPFGDTEWWPGIIFCSAFISVCWGYLVLQGNISEIWPLFGVSNQLLGTITLAIGTAVIYRMGRGRYAWVTMIPCLFMAVITCYADYLNIFDSYIPSGKWLLVLISVIMFVLVAIPSAMIPTFMLMWAFGFSLNLMTLMALSLVVGILVDDSIVVLENIYRHLEMGKTKRVAALKVVMKSDLQRWRLRW